MAIAPLIKFVSTMEAGLLTALMTETSVYEIRNSHATRWTLMRSSFKKQKVMLIKMDNFRRSE